ncbi:hypothetical protein UPYG_G00280620 [Umbra pygmaea]|uniref:Neural proliferation differentiation and control protein 1 n=1 Tax=Umbra pygmaea TaxID=75934 RepID=A0ABD0W326_UMBPY
MLRSKCIERQPRAPLLLGVVLCVILASVSASMPAGGKCPNHIDCAREGRHFCKPGTSSCGPCLNPLEENAEGHCVSRKRHAHGQVTSFATLDEEIDFLHAVIAKQEVAEDLQSKQSDNPTKVSSKTQTDASRKTGPIQTSTALPPIHTAHFTGALGRVGPEDPAGPIAIPHSSNDSLLIFVISGCVIVGIMALILATVFWVRMQKESHLSQKADYSAFGGHGKGIANGASSGDKNLAQSAQMFHYQHQKQQMISMEKHKSEPKITDSEVTSDDDEGGGDFTVYECPGLAPTGEMEVKNPLFDDSTQPYQGNSM